MNASRSSNVQVDPASPREESPSQPGVAQTFVAIGDIHGRLDLLEKLLAKIERKLGNTAYQTVFLGDYVDRGRDSAGVIDRLLSYQEERPDTIFLKGNHEQAMLDFLGSGAETSAWLSWGGEQTLRSYDVDTGLLPLDFEELQRQLAEALPEDHFRFLMGLRSIYEAGPYIFVHAGLDPDLPLEKQPEKALLWIREPFFEDGEAAFGNRIVVHGHTPVKRPDNLDWRINVDTGAVWSSKLTAVVLREKSRSFIST